MTYSETLDFLYSRLPMYHRIGAAAYKADLKNTLALCELLGHPEKKFRSVHIAGTNGKGSTSHMLAAILQKAGYKTGLYTSPHLKDFRERIRINGRMIPQDEVVSFVKEHKKEFEKTELSFFEWTVGLCFDYFAREKVDIAVIETGLGGRLDSTNVILPEISVITNISLDHVNLLGNTIKEIAREKAGIMKPGIPVVIGEEDLLTRDLFVETASRLRSPLYFASKNSRVTVLKKDIGCLTIDVKVNDHLHFTNLEVDLTGNYQTKNILGVLETVYRLRQQGWEITDDHIYAGLKNVKQLTGLMGRWQRINEKPLTICDVGHNEAGMKEVVKQLSKMKYRKLHIVMGMVNDKDISSILAILPADATYYFCKASIPRALDADVLKQQAEKFNLLGDVYPSVKSAFSAAQTAAGEEDLVFVGGSTFVVAEVL